VSDATRLLYGRKRGRKLRAGQQALYDTLLPKLRVALPAPGATLDLAALFSAAVRDVWLEVGFGGGEHLAFQAASHPDIGFIGCEPFVNGVVTLLARISAQGLANIRLFDDDARLLLAALPPAGVGRAFILFPDPWPKKRHHKRRIVSPAVLDMLALALKPGAELRLASDDASYVRWMLAHVIGHGAFSWLARRASDWRERPADWPATRYEEKAKKAGKSCYFLRFSRRPEAAESQQMPRKALEES
jgi:tRNA (guanine-N7-)-methyltransferase